jgi:hypothetical protein
MAAMDGFCCFGTENVSDGCLKRQRYSQFSIFLSFFQFSFDFHVLIQFSSDIAWNIIVAFRTDGFHIPFQEFASINS